MIISFLVSISALVPPPLSVHASNDPVREAVERAVPLIEKSAATYYAKRDCFSCHHQALPMMMLNRIGLSGFQLQEDTVSAQAEFTLEYFSERKERLSRGEGVPGGPYTAGYALAGLSAAGEQENETTKALVRYLLKTQNKDGSWHIRTHRPPLEDSHFTATALGIKGVHATGQSVIVKRAATWLIATQAKSTEDHVFKILGLHWAGRDQEKITVAKALLKLQGENGGWAQLPEMKSDAYATGSALVALIRAGDVPTDHVGPTPASSSPC